METAAERMQRHAAETVAVLGRSKSLELYAKYIRHYTETYLVDPNTVNAALLDDATIVYSLIFNHQV